MPKNFILVPYCFGIIEQGGAVTVSYTHLDVYKRQAMINALLDAVIVRLPISWLFAFVFSMGFSGVYYGQALSPVLSAIVGLLYFKSKKWERKALIQNSYKAVSYTHLYIWRAASGNL